MANGKPKTESKVLEPALRSALKKACEKDGEKSVSEAIGVSPETVARLMAGFPVRRSTLRVAEMYLNTKREASAAPAGGAQ